MSLLDPSLLASIGAEVPLTEYLARDEREEGSGSAPNLFGTQSSAFHAYF